MLRTVALPDLATLPPDELSDELERGRIVFFPDCPVELPSPEDMEFLRRDLPPGMKLKNVSYHPEAGRVFGLKTSEAARARVTRILKDFSARVQELLARHTPRLTQDWQVATSSFRPVQEQGRKLKPHASNELMHVDAGAYGATQGARILRFFVNIHPRESREWASKGTFAELYRRYAGAAGVAAAPDALDSGALERVYRAGLHGLARIVPAVNMLDTSPYDRAMRRFHNFMKDDPRFRDDPAGLVRFSFPPYSAWMCFTDAVSHAVLSGQFALVHTFIVPAKDCRFPEFLPLNLLTGGAKAAIAR